MGLRVRRDFASAGANEDLLDARCFAVIDDIDGDDCAAGNERIVVDASVLIGQSQTGERADEAASDRTCASTCNCGCQWTGNDETQPWQSKCRAYGGNGRDRGT